MCLTAIQAGAVQRRMISPSHSTPRASVFVEYHPAVQVGGDYGWARSVGDERMYAVVADVSGHGITSSLVASRIAPELFCSLIDFTEREIRYVNCGHPGPLLWSERYRVFAKLQAEDYPVGLFEPDFFGRPRAKTASFEMGDKLVLYTDGALGLRRPDGSELGEVGLREAFRGVLEVTTEESVKALFERFKTLHEAHPIDDLLVMIIDLHGGGSGTAEPAAP